ncbi:hypothetical protein [Rhizobium paknamense]|uniref:Uncharacterized protein n=1 Tax=Rhizobium paknamense TaxID=1206817 RepID=A0ABU0IGC8_9HYPH|nr:hypothetical protein [Rhizobium paknamense]MDQ0457294.1 hypothetical protein [Rhizobium paknamense]
MESHDVSLLKKFGLPEGVRSHEDLLTLLVLNSFCPEKCPEWETFFIESVADFILHRMPPENRVDQAKLLWIFETFTTEGRVNSPLESAMLTHLLKILVAESFAALRTARETGGWIGIDGAKPVAAA